VQTAQQEALIRKPSRSSSRARTRLSSGRSPLDAHQHAAIAGIVRDERGAKLVAVKGRPEKLKSAAATPTCSKGCDRYPCPA